MDVRLGVEATADAVAAAGADEVIVATGSRPPGTGFQRALPMVDRLPGVDGADVVLDPRRARRHGRRSVGGCSSSTTSTTGAASGRPLHLAERDHEVTILTAAPVVAGGLFHSAVDGPLRKRYAMAGGRSITSVCVLGWRDGVATVRSTLTGELTTVEADSARHRGDPGRRDGPRRRAARAGASPFHQIGDCVAPRRASLAFLEGRELALRL